MLSRLFGFATAAVIFGLAWNTFGQASEQALPRATWAPVGGEVSIPYGWVERTKEMQEGNDAAEGEVLLAIFERPPQAAGDTINSAAVIAAESAANYPGLKKAEDYLGPLTEATT